VDSTDFRRAMALLPTGVTVVTALSNGSPAGATAGAVSSLSLEPPLMLAALDRGSRTLNALRDSRRFAINVLAAEREELAHRFSTKEEHTVKWDGIDWAEHSGAPWIGGSVLAATCELRDLYDGGDHVIATGEVVEVDAPGGEPLVFWRGSYRGLG
jgi:3-hydroxy-9,10-secoandrosta-1,3,5(10)-triene-9,17-dione monooxygenase reductase component